MTPFSLSPAAAPTAASTAASASVSVASTAASTAINHLLEQEAWARDKLARHSGKVALFDAGVIALRLQVRPDGTVEVPQGQTQPTVTIRAALADLPLIIQDRAHAFSYVHIEGDADFANAISQLSESLRWDAEHDLARWIGDIPATRIAAAGRAAINGARVVQRRLEENVAEYFLEEQPMLVRRQDVAEFGDEVARLRDDIERLAKRIEKMEGSR